MNIHLCQGCPHRQQRCAGPCPCTIDGRDILDHAAAGDCPKGYFGAPGEMPPRGARPPGPQPAELLAELNRPLRELWAEIHNRPRAMKDAAAELSFLNDLVPARLPCGECRREWIAAMNRTPKDFSNPETYFAWTVDRHNEVNVRLGKPVVPLAEARCLYGWDCGCCR
jgi:hypothetical protein